MAVKRRFGIVRRIGDRDEKPSRYHTRKRCAVSGGKEMKAIIIGVTFVLASCISADAQGRTPGFKCTDWCAKCKPTKGCYDTCARSGNRNVNSSCSVRGNG